MINPYTWEIDGDLSRADVLVLYLLCRNKFVVEFGIGASTILLSQIAQKVITYEHDQSWIDRTAPKLNDNVEINKIEKDPEVVKDLGQECDVLFDDGHSLLRTPALLAFWPHLKECAILHDSRMTYAGNCVKAFLSAFIPNPEPTPSNPNNLPDNPFTGSLDTIYWNYLDSNMVVMHKKAYTLKYEDWKRTER
jgi:hypothetical protein